MRPGETWQQWAARTCPPEHRTAVADNLNNIETEPMTEPNKQREQSRLRVQRLRERQRAEGLIRREYTATQKEHAALASVLDQLRGSTP